MTALLDPAFVPFSLALGLLFGLLALEVIVAVLGGTILGLGGQSDLDLDVDLDAGVEAGLEMGDVDLDLDVADIAEIADASDTAGAASAAAASGPGDWLGLSKVPTLIWVASALLGFGASGLALQTVSMTLLGSPLPAGLVAIGAGAVALLFARGFSGAFATLIPKTESTALSQRSLGRRRGIISQGTAARGRPAEVRVTDGQGNTHYLRAEPLRDDDEIRQGTPVLVMRNPRTRDFRLIALSDL